MLGLGSDIFENLSEYKILSAWLWPTYTPARHISLVAGTCPPAVLAGLGTDSSLLRSRCWPSPGAGRGGSARTSPSSWCSYHAQSWRSLWSPPPCTDPGTWPRSTSQWRRGPGSSSSCPAWCRCRSRSPPCSSGPQCRPGHSGSDTPPSSFLLPLPPPDWGPEGWGAPSYHRHLLYHTEWRSQGVQLTDQPALSPLSLPAGSGQFSSVPHF